MQKAERISRDGSEATNEPKELKESVTKSFPYGIYFSSLSNIYGNIPDNRYSLKMDLFLN